MNKCIYCKNDCVEEIYHLKCHNKCIEREKNGDCVYCGINKATIGIPIKFTCNNPDCEKKNIFKNY